MAFQKTVHTVLAATFVVACGSAEDPVGVDYRPTDAGGNADAAAHDASTAVDGGGVNTDAAVVAFDARVPTTTGDGGCASTLAIVVRDFTEQHPDFEKFTAAVTGIVAERLGDDKKPVYAPSGATAATTSKENFDQWYRDTPGVNVQVPVAIGFTESSPGVFVYDNSSFFPIDGMGLGNGPATGVNIPIIGPIGGGPTHNYLFTTEAHTRFTYRGGETFTFRGDDDLWVFINNQLAVDLGGTHSALMQSINLDERAQDLAISVGQTYDMDIFHAERHTVESNYRIETTIDLSCIENVPIR